MESSDQRGEVTGRAGISVPLSLEALSKRCMGNPQITLLVLERFERQLQTDIGAMESRLTASDMQEISRIAHALKGAAGAAGAAGVQAAAAAVESVAKRAELSALAEQVRVLRDQVDACLTFIPSARRAVGGPMSSQNRSPEAH